MQRRDAAPQHIAETTADQLTIQRDVALNPSAEARRLLDTKIAEYTAEAQKYEREKAEIKTQAEGLAQQYDALNVHDDQFDMSEACLSVGIALMGVTALTRKRWLLAVAAAFAGFGALSLGTLQHRTQAEHEQKTDRPQGERGHVAGEPEPLKPEVDEA